VSYPDRTKKEQRLAVNRKFCLTAGDTFRRYRPLLLMVARQALYDPSQSTWRQLTGTMILSAFLGAPARS
jgi:hypothetical protein